MAKVAAEVGIGAALIGASLLIPGGFLAAGALLTGTSPFANLLAVAGAGFVLSGVGTLLAQKATGVHTTSRNPLSPWQVVYGRKKVGATIIYQEEVASNNRLLLLVCVVACHSVQEIEAVWFNNKKVLFQIDPQFTDAENPNGFWQSYDPPQGTWAIETISRVNDVVSVTFTQNPNSLYSGFNGETVQIFNTVDAAGGSTFEGYWPIVQTGPNSFTYTAGGPQGAGQPNTGTVKSTWPQYQGTITASYYTGDQTTAAGDILGNTVGYWTNASLVSGRAYVALKVAYDSSIYSGLPEISFVVRGKNDIYDPRTGTRGYTNNAALCIADYLNQPTFGFNIPYGPAVPSPSSGAVNIPIAQLIAAANVCDEQVQLASGATEPRYQCDGAFDVSVRRGEVLQNLLTSCAGRLVYLGGQFIVQPAAWVTPSGSITVGAGNTGPQMMMNSLGLVAERYNNPTGAYVPDCAGTTRSQFVYALGMLMAYEATGNSNAKALAQLILSALLPVLFRGTPVPSRVTASAIWSPNSFFAVKQAFLGDDGVTINVDQDFASDLATPAGWRLPVGAEIQTSCDAYNLAMRLFALAAKIFDGATQTDAPDLGYGLSPYGNSYGDPETAVTTVNSGWLAMLIAIQQMARIATFVAWPAQYSGNTATTITINYQGGMIPFIAEFTGAPAPALNGWVGPAYTGYQSPWAIKQLNPSLVAQAVQFLAEAQADLAAHGTVADTVTFTVTGPNAQTGNVAIQVDSAGNASATFSYAGTAIGTDSITATLPSHSLTSNQAKIAWSAYAAPVAVFGVQIAVMAADGSGLFNGLSAVLSTQAVQGLMFNAHPQSIFPGDPHQSGNQANPFVSNIVDATGGYQGDQAINNTSGRFNAVITGTISIETAGSYTWTVYVNSAFVIGIKGATYVSGPQDFGALAGGTAQMNYTPLAGLNSPGSWPGGDWAEVNFTTHHAAPGLYDFEVDFASGLFSEREFCMFQGTGAIIPNVALLDSGGTSASGTAPSGQLQLTPFSGGYALGQTATFTLQLAGVSYTGPTAGPFAPVYQYAVPEGVETWLPVNVFGFAGPDPNYAAGYFQYRPLAELCDLVASAAGTETWYTQASTVISNFLLWIHGKWTTAATGPPNHFPQTGAQTTAVDVQCAALILYSVLSLDLSARPTGAGGPGAMNSTQYALLNSVYTLLGDTYVASGAMAGSFCIDPSGNRDWSPIWAGELLRALSQLVTWATVNAQASIRAQAIVWIDGLINFGLQSVVVVDPDLGYTVNDLRGGITWTPKLARTELFNGIKGTYISEANQWQQSDFPSYAQDTIHGYTNGTPGHNNDANWDADGQRLWKDVQLPFTTSVSMAQRLAKIELMRIRQQGRGKLPGIMTMYQSAPLDTVYFSYPGWWVNKVMEIANVRLVPFNASTPGGEEVPLLGTEIDIQEADPSVYEWSATEELSAQGYSYLPGLADATPD